MRLPLLAAALLAGFSQVAAGQDAGGLTTGALRARSPLAAALGARVEEPRALPGLEPPAGDGEPSMLMKVLTPRDASGLFTQVVGGGLSLTEFDLRSTHGLRGVPPFVTVSPGLNVVLPDGPDTRDFAAPGPDLNEGLWGVNAELMAFMPLSERWAAQVAVAPGVYSDFEAAGRDLVRVPGRVLGIYTHSPRTQFTVGAVYLARDDVGWLPAVGMIHRPTDRTAIELILPRPRVIHRFWGTGKDDGGFGYVAGELGGGMWSVRRSASGPIRQGFADTATLSDLRLLGGLEVKRTGRLTWLAETGYVFNRQVEYQSGVGDANFGEAWLIRVGVRR